MIQCRLCMQEQETPSQTHWMTPCRCKGSQAFIHAECLCMWFKHESYPDVIQCTVCLQNMENPMLLQQSKESISRTRFIIRIILTYVIILFPITYYNMSTISDIVGAALHSVSIFGLCFSLSHLCVHK